MKIKFSHKFIKQQNKAPVNIQNAFDQKLEMFQENPQHPLLKNHSLVGKLQDCRSINITGDWRAIFKELDNGEIVFFIMIGTHSQLY